MKAIRLISDQLGEGEADRPTEAHCAVAQHIHHNMSYVTGGINWSYYYSS